MILLITHLLTWLILFLSFMIDPNFKLLDSVLGKMMEVNGEKELNKIVTNFMKYQKVLGLMI